MSDQIFYLFSAVLLGLVFGALIMYFATGSNKQSDKTIAKLEKELSEYKNNVAEHFEQTADLVDGMTESYKKVFDHLGKSARNLMTEEQIQKQQETRKGNKVTLEYLPASSDEEQVVYADEEVKVSDSVEEVVEELANTEVESSEVVEPEVVEPEVEGFGDESNEVVESTEKEPADVESTQEAEEVAKEAELKKLEKEVELREKNIYS